MKVGDGETQPGRWLEASGGRVHSDGGRRKGVIRWEDQSPPVLAAMIRGILGTGNNIMPPVGSHSQSVSQQAWRKCCKKKEQRVTRLCWTGRDVLEDVRVGRVGCDIRGRVLRDGFVLARQLEKRQETRCISMKTKNKDQ